MHCMYYMYMGGIESCRPTAPTGNLPRLPKIPLPGWLCRAAVIGRRRRETRWNYRTRTGKTEQVIKEAPPPPQGPWVCARALEPLPCPPSQRPPPRQRTRGRVPSPCSPTTHRMGRATRSGGHRLSHLCRRAYLRHAARIRCPVHVDMHTPFTYYVHPCTDWRPHTQLAPIWLS